MFPRNIITSVFRAEEYTELQASDFPRSVSLDFLLDFLFDPEDEDDMFFRKVTLSPNYMILQNKKTPFGS
jgi:hypothetical protein